MSMKEAISKFVHSGDILFLSGTQHGEPSAAIHEIVRQRIDHLTLICCLVATSGLLIAEGLLDKMITAFTMRDEKRAYALARARRMNKLPVFEMGSKRFAEGFVGMGRCTMGLRLLTLVNQTLSAGANSGNTGRILSKNS